MRSLFGAAGAPGDTHSTGATGSTMLGEGATVRPGTYPGLQQAGPRRCARLTAPPAGCRSWWMACRAGAAALQPLSERQAPAAAAAAACQRPPPHWRRSAPCCTPAAGRFCVAAEIPPLTAVTRYWEGVTCVWTFGENERGPAEGVGSAQPACVSAAGNARGRLHMPSGSRTRYVAWIAQPERGPPGGTAAITSPRAVHIQGRRKSQGSTRSSRARQLAEANWQTPVDTRTDVHATAPRSKVGRA
jgi:hypothetical protein